MIIDISRRMDEMIEEQTDSCFMIIDISRRTDGWIEEQTGSCFYDNRYIQENGRKD